MGSLKDSVVPEFKNMKFRIKDEEHSKKVQDFLLNLGYRWGRGFTETFIPQTKYIYTNKNSQITGSVTSSDDAYQYFLQHENEEYQLKETISYSLEEVKPKSKIGDLTVKVNLEVTVNGEKVSLNNLENLVNKLNATDVVKFEVK